MSKKKLYTYELAPCDDLKLIVWKNRLWLKIKARILQYLEEKNE